MQPRALRKKDLPSFLKKLQKSAQLIAPVKKDILRFSEIKDVNDVVLSGHPLFSAKKYFYLPKHELFSYSNGKITEPNLGMKRIIFGLRLCDINSLLKLDRLFLDETPEENYKKARENTILIGLNCETPPKEVCFCQSVGVSDAGYDLMLCDAGDSYHIKVGSKKGETLAKDLPQSSFTPMPIKNDKALLTTDIKSIYNDKKWDDNASRCISCGACTALCPNCLCFDVYDEPSFGNNSSLRSAEWDSCQFKDFTKVAGGHVFRDKRESRLKHRIYHKLDYYKQRFGENMCTGCGRCIEGCPTRIDFVKTINEIGKK